MNGAHFRGGLQECPEENCSETFDGEWTPPFGLVECFANTHLEETSTSECSEPSSSIDDVSIILDMLFEASSRQASFTMTWAWISRGPTTKHLGPAPMKLLFSDPCCDDHSITALRGHQIRRWEDYRSGRNGNAYLRRQGYQLLCRRGTIERLVKYLCALI